MQKLRIKKVGVLSLGKFMSAIWAVLGLIIGLLYGAIFGVMGLTAMGSSSTGYNQMSGAALIGIAAGMAIGAPIMYAIMGFIGGLVTAVVYNFASGFIGGVELDVELGDAMYQPPQNY